MICESSLEYAQEGEVPLPGLSAPPPPPRFPLSLALAAIEARRPRQEGELVLPFEQPLAAAIVVVLEGLQEQELQEQQELKKQESHRGDTPSLCSKFKVFVILCVKIRVKGGSTDNVPRFPMNLRYVEVEEDCVLLSKFCVAERVKIYGDVLLILCKRKGPFL